MALACDPFAELEAAQRERAGDAADRHRGEREQQCPGRTECAHQHRLYDDVELHNGHLDRQLDR